jgi:hypothetical protein
VRGFLHNGIEQLIDVAHTTVEWVAPFQDLGATGCNGNQFRCAGTDLESSRKAHMIDVDQRPAAVAEQSEFSVEDRD